MSLLKMIGMDYYRDAAQLQQEWVTTDVNNARPEVGAGRFGDQALFVQDPESFGVSQYARLPLDAPESTLFVGFAFMIPELPSGKRRLFAALNGTTEIVRLRVDSLGKISADRGTTEVAVTTAAVVSAGVWYHLEVKIVIHDSTGAIEVRIDGNTTPVINFSGDTKPGADTDADNVGVTFTHSGVFVDDFYVLDDAGSKLNNFLGDSRIYTMIPRGVGSSTQLTSKSGGANYTEVRDLPDDQDNSYVFSATAGHKDLYALGELPGASLTIHAVKQTVVARKTDAGARSVIPKLLSNLTESGSAQVLGTGYGFHSQLLEDDPDTATDWTQAGVEAAEIGLEVV